MPGQKRSPKTGGAHGRGLGRNVLEAIYASWIAKDVDAIVSCLSDDVAVMIHVPSDVMPRGGETPGKAEAEQKMRALLLEFEFLDYRPVLISDVGDTYHAQVHYRFRHKHTGHEIEGLCATSGRQTGTRSCAWTSSTMPSACARSSSC